MGYKEKSPQICWSCGKPIPCDCGENVILDPTKPKSVLPFCGKVALDYSSRTNPDIPQTHYCCKCKKPYVATLRQWAFGTCPHCGASGPEPD